MGSSQVSCSSIETHGQNTTPKSLLLSQQQIYVLMNILIVGVLNLQKNYDDRAESSRTLEAGSRITNIPYETQSPCHNQ